MSTKHSPDAARQRFAELISGEDEEIDVAEAALCIAAEHVALDVPEQLDQLAQLADRMRPDLDPIASHPLTERVHLLNRHMFQHEGFHGCAQEDYYEPRNSFLNEVLKTRSGIPITLSIVYVDVARRLGLRSAGIGFPGHFLAKVEPSRQPGSSVDDAPIVVDPFEGRAIDQDECSNRLKLALGPQAQFDPNWLRAASGREILFRVLGNLKHNYLARKDWASALLCTDRSLLVFPNSPLEVRDRGILYQHLECFGAAADDLERFLELAPDHESAAVIRKSLSALRARSSTIH